MTLTNYPTSTITYALVVHAYFGMIEGELTCWKACYEAVPCLLHHLVQISVIQGVIVLPGLLVDSECNYVDWAVFLVIHGIHIVIDSLADSTFGREVYRLQFVTQN